MINAPRRPGDPPILYAVADRAAEILGRTPRFLSIKNTVGTAEDWFLLVTQYLRRLRSGPLHRCPKAEDETGWNRWLKNCSPHLRPA